MVFKECILCEVILKLRFKIWSHWDSYRALTFFRFLQMTTAIPICIYYEIFLRV